MARLQPAMAIVLTPAQQAILEQWSRQRQGPAGRVQRAKLLLLAASGTPNHATARAVGLGVRMVRMWRQRWQEAKAALADAEDQDLSELLDDILSDAPRSGTPPTFTPEQIAKILVVACEKPEDSGRPVTHWTPRELAEEVIARGIVPTISVRHIGRFLKRSGPQAAPQSVLVDAST